MVGTEGQLSFLLIEIPREEGLPPLSFAARNLESGVRSQESSQEPAAVSLTEWLAGSGEVMKLSASLRLAGTPSENHRAARHLRRSSTRCRALAGKGPHAWAVAGTSGRSPPAILKAAPTLGPLLRCLRRRLVLALGLSLLLGGLAGAGVWFFAPAPQPQVQTLISGAAPGAFLDAAR